MLRAAVTCCLASIVLSACSPSRLPVEPPPGDDHHASAEGPKPTPMTVRPRLQNREEISRALQRYYPPGLRDMKLGGTANVWFFIDQDGRVVKAQLNESSGYAALDRAALRVARLMRFSPAYKDGEKVPVWIALNVTFMVSPIRRL